MSSRRRHDSAAYSHFEARMRGVWLGSMRAGVDEEAIARDAACTPADAFRVAVLRRAACPTLVELWLRGDLSVRQLGRIVVLDAPLLEPHDEREQLELAAHYPAAARRLKPPAR